jgi:hypothetical protein
MSDSMSPEGHNQVDSTQSKLAILKTKQPNIIPLIYKYPHMMKLLTENNTLEFWMLSTPLYRRFIPPIYNFPFRSELSRAQKILKSKIIFYNPYENFMEFHHNKLENSVVDELWIKNEEGHLKLFSSHSSNNAIDMMIKNPQLINLDGLVINLNIRITPLLEMKKSEFTDLQWGKMSYSRNPAILAFLEENMDQIYWFGLSSNDCDDAIRILENNLDKVDWENFANNRSPKMSRIIETQFEKNPFFSEDTWTALSINPSAFEFLEKHKEKINWYAACNNTHPRIFELLDKYIIWFLQVGWDLLSRNPNAIAVISKNLDKISWNMLSRNPNAIAIILNNLDKVSWGDLSLNPNAIEILMEHPERIVFKNFLKNPNLLKYKNAISYVETMLDTMSERERDLSLKAMINNTNCIPLLDHLLMRNKIDPVPLKALLNVSFRYEIMGFFRQNMSVFDLDYKAMSKFRSYHYLEIPICEIALHPSNVEKWTKHEEDEGRDWRVIPQLN